jgi:predicted SAM-dependent methyltransferase
VSAAAEKIRSIGLRALSAPGVIRFRLRRRRLAARYLRGNGIEVGALHQPLKVPSAATVRYVDRMTVDDLHKHYPELAREPLVPVDIVDDGETLASQADASADFIIANHFIEHTQNPLGTLANHLRVLRPGGVLYMAVPDRRRTFDVDRSATPLQHLVQDYSNGPEGSRSEHFAEWARFVERVPADQVAARAQELEEQDYSIHFHVWTAEEFKELLGYAQNEQQLPFRVEELRENELEFIAVLRRS